jgi:hypothetical protein
MKTFVQALPRATQIVLVNSKKKEKEIRRGLAKEREQAIPVLRRLQHKQGKKPQ